MNKKQRDAMQIIYPYSPLLMASVTIYWLLGEGPVTAFLTFLVFKFEEPPFHDEQFKLVKDWPSWFAIKSKGLPDLNFLYFKGVGRIFRGE